MKKKLYLFGDSFSMINSKLNDEEIWSKYIELNSHYSLANDHIIKLTKIKLLKLIERGIENTNILVQLTIPNRMLVIGNNKLKESSIYPQNLLYSFEHIPFADKEIFEQNMYSTVYPYSSCDDDPIIKYLFLPHIQYTVENNYRKILKDIILELNILKLLAEKNKINLEYFFYTKTFDYILEDLSLESKHIRFDKFDSMETFLKKNFEISYFFSKFDIHLNEQGMTWYLDFLRKRYDF